MIHNVVTKVNDILAQAAGVQTGDLKLADGVTTLKNVKYCAVEPGGYMRMDDGSPIQLFTKVTTDGYRKVTGEDGKDYWVMNEEYPDSPESLCTIGNLQLNQCTWGSCAVVLKQAGKIVKIFAVAGNTAAYDRFIRSQFRQDLSVCTIEVTSCNIPLSLRSFVCRKGWRV